MFRLVIGLAQWRSPLAFSFLIAAEESTVTIRKLTNNLESSLCCSAIPVSWMCVYATLFNGSDTINAREKTFESMQGKINECFNIVLILNILS